MKNLNKKLNGLFYSYLIIIIGQLLSVYIAIITVKTSNFTELYLQNLSIYIENPLTYYLLPLVFWNLFTGFLIFAFIFPIVKFFRNSIPKFLWLLLFIGQVFLLKEFSIKSANFEFYIYVFHIIPSFISLFIAIYFQSKLDN